MNTVMAVTPFKRPGVKMNDGRIRSVRRLAGRRPGPDEIFELGSEMAEAAVDIANDAVILRNRSDCAEA